MARTMYHCFVNHVLVEVHPELPPSDADWDELLVDARAHLDEDSIGSAIVVSDGPGPNAIQRRKLAAIPGAHARPVAVVTHSALARGGVTALHWLGHAIKAFAPQNLSEALVYARVPDADRETVLRCIAEFKCHLAGQSLVTVKDAAEAARMTAIIAAERVENVRARMKAMRPNAKVGALP